jgi:hypothetical protein
VRRLGQSTVARPMLGFSFWGSLGGRLGQAQRCVIVLRNRGVIRCYLRPIDHGHLPLATVMCVICLSVLSKLPEPKRSKRRKTQPIYRNKWWPWGPSGCARLGFSLGFDYLFMAAYVTAIGLGCAVVAGRARAWLHLLGMILAYAQIIGSWRNRERSPATVMSCFAVVLEGNE